MLLNSKYRAAKCDLDLGKLFKFKWIDRSLFQQRYFRDINKQYTNVLKQPQWNLHVSFTKGVFSYAFVL